MSEQITELFQGFSKLKREERFQRLLKMGALNPEDVVFLKQEKGLSLDLAEHFIENVIGSFPLPLGVATHFVIDGRPYLIPMAVEETSIVAAASKTAKWVSQKGKITTQTFGKNIIGQIQIAHIKNFEKLQVFIKKYKSSLMKEVNERVAFGLVRRGGGVQDLYLRKVDRGDGSFMAVVHVLADPCNAMGANIMNQIVEYLKRPLEDHTGEKVTMCIVSNLVDTKITKAQVRLNQIDPFLAEKLEEASLFAKQDPYRAATHNKGVLNGIDPILIATGNDWRAVEAGVHAYAARKGRYEAITEWKREGSDLLGTFEAPLVVGTVGGVTRLHPMARMTLHMLAVESAEELSRICAAVGLVQNLGALKALTTEGIIEGHMKLHIKNLILSVGAEKTEEAQIQKKLENVLFHKKRISLRDAVEALEEIRR